MITDEEKLTLIDEYERVAWETLQRVTPVGAITYFDLETIERCQRIRANLLKPSLPSFSSVLGRATSDDSIKVSL